MKALSWWFYGILSLGLAAPAGSMLQAQSDQPPPIYQGRQWEPLFDGSTLEGWFETGNEKWYVDNGTIVGETFSGRNSFLATRRTFTNFELHLRFRALGGNSGVFYHTTLDEQGEFIGGMQVEIDARINRHTGGLHEPRGRGWVVWPAPENETVLRLNAWNDLLVRVADNRVITRLNGVVMVDFTDPRPRDRSGVIALQVHGGEGIKHVFKDIWVRELGGGGH